MAGTAGEFENRKAQGAGHGRQYLRRRVLAAAFKFGQVLRCDASACGDVSDALATVGAFGAQLLADCLTPQRLGFGLGARSRARPERNDVVHDLTVATVATGSERRSLSAQPLSPIVNRDQSLGRLVVLRVV